MMPFARYWKLLQAKEDVIEAVREWRRHPSHNTEQRLCDAADTLFYVEREDLE